MRIPICHCSRCHSQNTIRVHEELQHEHWYCYDCGRGFEVLIGDIVASQGRRSSDARLHDRDAALVTATSRSQRQAF